MKTKNHNLKQKIKNIIFTILFLITGIQAIAQTYPVQAIPQITQPPAVNLSDYASLNNTTDRIKLQLLLTDLTVLNREVKLKLYIEGNGIKAQSNDFVIGVQPLFLEGGIPLQLGSIDLAPYFELQNLKGISVGAYANTLPDGLYQFCFEVYDVLSGNVISRKSCTNVLIFLNDPPFLNLPENQANIAVYNLQNLLFQWTPRHINVSNVEYEFSLVEIYDNVMSPEAVFVSSPPIYQTTVQTTSLLYGLAEPQLLEGKRYAWRVQARALDGVDEIGMFKNNGYSEIFSFTYQGECEAPAYLTIDEVTSQNATFKWQGGFDHTQYKIAYRKAIDNDGNSGQQNNFAWFESTTNSEQFTVIDLEPNTLYEWRVGGFCADGTLTFSDSKSFTTMEADAEAYYNCGIEPTIDIANQTLIDKLQVGDVVKAGDFNVKIKEVSGSNSFSGKGYTTVGFLKNLKIALVFTNIQVNTNYQFVNGEIKTEYDPSWSNILDVDGVIDVVEDVGDLITGDDNINITLDYNITESDITVDPQAGTITITDDNNDPQVYDYDEGDFYTITDASGDQFSVDTEGNVRQTGVGAEGGPATATNTNGVSDGHKNNVNDPAVNTIQKHNIVFTYKKGTAEETKYELDQANNDYEKAIYPKVNVAGGGSYYPVHKAVVEGTTDTFDVEVTNSTDYIKTDSLIFKTVYGTEIPSTRTVKGYKLTVKGRHARISEEAIITYKDNTGKQHVLSSFFIYHLKKFPPVAINVVRINGADDITNLQNKLNKIYGSTGVTFTVNNVEEFEVPEAVWDVDVVNKKIDYNGSGLDSDYPKELNAIKNYYKQEHSGYDAKAYYLFLIDDSMPVTKALSGFMPKTRQWGFVFQAHLNEGLENKKEPADIAAHELGHGVFALAHPFDKPENSGKADNWLMDYGNGTELAYPNWANMSSDALKLYLFQSDQGSESAVAFVEIEPFDVGSGIADGIEPSGKIIQKISINDSNKFVIKGISSSYQYTIYSISVYEYTNTEKTNWQKIKTYRAQFNNNGVFTNYTTNEGEVFSGTITYKNSGSVYISYKLDNDECNYLYNSISWNSTEIAASDLITQLGSKWQTFGNKKTGTFFSPDPSCFITNSLASLIQNDTNSNICNDDKIATDVKELNALFDKTSYTDEEVIALIVNKEICLSTLRQISWENLSKAFNQLGSSNEIKENKEICLLRIMAAINSNNYSDFITLLEGKNKQDSLLLNLIDKIHDKSLNPFDGDNFTSFISGLLAIYNLKPEAWQDRINSIENNDLLGQVVSLSPFSFDSPSFGSFLISLNQAKFEGELNSANEIEITRWLKVLSNASPIPVWAKDSDFETVKLSPLDPVIILTKDNLPLVTTAINGIEPIGENLYIVPAIFLEYKTQKEFNDAVETGIILTIDAATIIGSGGTVLATKVHWARRLWALAEVVGATGNITLNTANIDPNSNLGKTTNYFNAAMGIVGLKNGAVGLKNVVKNIPQVTKNLIKTKSSIKELLLAQYINYRIAITRLRNSDDWGQLPLETRQVLASEKRLYDELVDIDNSTTYHWGTESTNFINGKTADDILDIPKPNRPKPSTYLRSNSLNTHKQLFDSEGGAFLVVKSWIEGGSFNEFPIRKYVMLNSDMSDAITKYRTSRNISDLEDALGYRSGDLSGLDDEIFVFYVKNDKYKFEMPNGNEIGANNLWIPGGKTSGGYREAVIIDKLNPSAKIIHNKNIEELKSQFDYVKVKDF